MFNEKTKTLTIPKGIVIINQIFWYFFNGIDKSEIKKVVIPNTVTKIGNLTFAHCKNLKSISIPNGVTEIGGGAFADCTSLESISIPNTVTRIGTYAFASCTNLESITIPEKFKNQLRNFGIDESKINIKYI